MAANGTVRRRPAAEDETAPASDHVDDGLDWSLLPILDFDDPDFDAYLREKVQEALDDPRPSIPIEDVTRRLEELYRRDMEESGRDPWGGLPTKSLTRDGQNHTASS